MIKGMCINWCQQPASLKRQIKSCLRISRRLQQRACSSTNKHTSTKKCKNTTGDTEGKKWYLYQEIVPKRVLLDTIVESKNGPRKSQLREKHTEKVIGNFNFYSRAVHPTMMAVIGKLVADQTQGTTETTADVAQLFDYCATHYGKK